ncbi:MAG: chromosome partitioning protein [Candidatus Methylomirabilota bacterium]|nr:Mrp/NBP35 family ATP-binding protein [candidate division NC10 bacterium]PWB46062.1 MAG: chromosome partitioning protein [candidate division NC10 bacterium]
MVTPRLTEDTIISALREVKYPGMSRDLVSFGMIKNTRVEGADVYLDLQIPTEDTQVIAKVEASVREALGRIPGIGTLYIQTVRRQAPQESAPGPAPLPGVRRIIAVASGKGGVGKSTVSVNLALALAQSGAVVGLLDADIYGPNVPRMLGEVGRPKAHEGKIVPLVRYGLNVISVGYLLGDQSPIIWRGPLVAQALKQLLHEVHWGGLDDRALDYLIVDLPPGTGDTQLTLVQSVPLTGGVIVTTPSVVALMDAERGLRMFREARVPILGIVENMSYFICPHCQGETDIFSRGGGRQVSESLGVPFLGEIPLNPAIREGGDHGAPIVVAMPESAEAQIFRAVAEKVRLAAETAAEAMPQMTIR